jgi:four helix bundle protein
MDKEKTVYSKSEKFAVRIVNLSKYLCDAKKEFTISKQILRSGTSIMANLSEANRAISKQDWLAKKVYIALKETSETAGWLRLLCKTNYINEKEFESIYKDCIEIEKMLNSSTKTTKQQILNAKQ